MLDQDGAVSLTWESGSGPLAGMPDVDLTTAKPTGRIFGEGGFGCVVGFQAKRNGESIAEGNGKEAQKQVQFAAKFLFDEHGVHGAGSSRAETVDKLGTELNLYRGVIEARHEGKVLGTHPNLCEIYGIVTMDVNGTRMRALLMEAVPGHSAQTTAEFLRYGLDAGYFAAREYWGAIQYLCDRPLDVANHFKKAKKVHRDFKQENVLVRNDGVVKIIDNGLATRKGDRSYRGTDEYMADDYKEGGVNAATDAFAIGATAVEMVEGYDRKFSKNPKGNFVTLLPKQGAMPGYIQRTNARGKVGATPVNQFESAFSKFVNTLLSRAPGVNPAEPDDGKGMDFINDPMMGPEEAQAVIRAAFRLAEIEGKKERSARWEPRADARQIALRLIRNKEEKPQPASTADQPGMDTTSGLMPLESIKPLDLPKPLELLRFENKPSLENYFELTRYYRTRPDRDDIIRDTLTARSNEELGTLSAAISEKLYSEERSLCHEGAWLKGLVPWLDIIKTSPRHQEALSPIKTGVTKDGIRSDVPTEKPTPSVRFPHEIAHGGTRAEIEDELARKGKSIDELRTYITNVYSLFAKVNMVLHPLPHMDLNRFKELNGLRRIAVELMGHYNTSGVSEDIARDITRMDGVRLERYGAALATAMKNRSVGKL